MDATKPPKASQAKSSKLHRQGRRPPKGEALKPPVLRVEIGENLVVYPKMKLVDGSWEISNPEKIDELRKGGPDAGKE